MKINYLRTLLICAVWLFMPIFFVFSDMGMRDAAFDYPFPPQLRYPVTEEVNLSGKDFLEFSWEIRDTTDTRYYDFRLYKGYNMYVSGLILKERVPNGTFSFKVSAASFEDNQIYTWSLRRANLAGQKSDVSFNSFRVIKK